MSPGLAEALPALLLEHAQLRAARLAIDDAHDFRVGDKGRSGDDVARALFDEQHLIEREGGAVLAGCAVDFNHGAGRHFDLPATGLDNRVHEQYLNRDRVSADGVRPACANTTGSQIWRGWRKTVRRVRKDPPYWRRMRVPLIFWLLRVLRKLGIRRSINSK